MKREPRTFSSIWSLAIGKENPISPWRKPHFSYGKNTDAPLWFICTLPILSNTMLQQFWTFCNSLQVPCSLLLSWLLESLPAFQHPFASLPSINLLRFWSGNTFSRKSFLTLLSAPGALTIFLESLLKCTINWFFMPLSPPLARGLSRAMNTLYSSVMVVLAWRRDSKYSFELSPHKPGSYINLCSVVKTVSIYHSD